MSKKWRISPTKKTLPNLAGKRKLNKYLSTDVAPVLALQGTSLLIRKAISSASVTLMISQPQKDKYEFEQTVTAAGIPETTEQYILDGEWRTNHDAFFGEVKGRSQWISLDEAKSKMQGVTGNGWDVESDDGKLILAGGGSTEGLSDLGL
ncbi:MAG: hypothetical protein Q9188_002592 [Gyalolechia gomerana]